MFRPVCQRLLGVSALDREEQLTGLPDLHRLVMIGFSEHPFGEFQSARVVSDFRGSHDRIGLSIVTEPKGKVVHPSAR